MSFAIQSPEGLPIRGNLDVPGEHPRALVVIVHGFKGFKDWGFFPWVAERLLQHQFAVCRFNMSRSGIGDDPESFERLDLFEHDTYSIELADLRAVVRHVHPRLPDLPIFLLGHSRGGGLALLGAQDVPDLRGVAVWAPIAHCHRWDEATVRDWRKHGFQEIMNARTKQWMRVSTDVLDDVEANRERLDILAATSRLRVPLLVIHGRRDESVPFDEGREIASRAEDGSLLAMNRAGHTFNAIHPLVTVPFELLVAAEATAHFFKGNC